MPKNKKLALDSGIQTNQILTNDDDVCIPRLSSIFLAVAQATWLLHFTLKSSSATDTNILKLVGSSF